MAKRNKLQIQMSLISGKIDYTYAHAHTHTHAHAPTQILVSLGNRGRAKFTCTRAGASAHA